MKTKGFRLLISAILATGFLANAPALRAESIITKASETRIDLIRYLRAMRPMVFNFPCEPFPECRNNLSEEERQKEPWKRIDLYKDAKRIFQEGLIYFYEQDYINAYNRFLDAQLRTDRLLEEVSQSYIDRTQKMLRDAVEKKYSDIDIDKSVVDITMELGQNSKYRRDFNMTRQAGFEERRYDPKMVHYATNKKEIEDNMGMGYQFLGLAKKARIKAIKIEEDIPSHRHIEPRQRKQRIDLYLDTIRLARQAKFNAERIYHLKYPYDNYALLSPYSKNEEGTGYPAQGQFPTIGGVTMRWAEHPNLLPKKLHPIFDLSIPEQYRIDAVDIRNLRYDDEVDSYLKFKHRKKKPDIVVSGGTAPANGTQN